MTSARRRLFLIGNFLITCIGHCGPWALVDDIANKMKGMADDNPVYANTTEVDEVFNWMH